MWPRRRPLDEKGEAAAVALAERDAFHSRVSMLLDELTVAARHLGVKDRVAVARRALDLLVDRARES